TLWVIATAEASYQEIQTILAGASDFEILKLNEGCTPAAVRKAYLEASRRVHPDKCDDLRAGEAFIRVSVAFERLSHQSQSASVSTSTECQSSVRPAFQRSWPKTWCDFMRDFQKMEAQFSAQEEARERVKKEERDVRAAERRLKERKQKSGLQSMLVSGGLEDISSLRSWKAMFKAPSATGREEVAPDAPKGEGDTDVSTDALAAMEATLKCLAAGKGRLPQSSASSVTAVTENSALHKWKSLNNSFVKSSQTQVVDNAPAFRPAMKSAPADSLAATSGAVETSSKAIANANARMQVPSTVFTPVTPATVVGRVINPDRSEWIGSQDQTKKPTRQAQAVTIPAGAGAINVPAEAEAVTIPAEAEAATMPTEEEAEQELLENEMK
ncbi:hypothetical protein CYMTET_34329, partial [Cymbomonas tetramitiformis]